MKVQETKGTTLPGGWIVNPKDKGRKPIKSGNIYLDDNESFEIELYNPLKVNVLADIRLNGQSISKTGLIVKPGQRFYLDCFVDDKKKFIFQTYHVDGSVQTQEAIADNGLMEVFFYKEDVVTLQNWAEKYRKTVVREYYPIYIDRYPYWYPYHQPAIWYGGSLSGTTTTSNISNTLSSNTLAGNYTNTSSLSSDIGNYTSNVSFNSNTSQLINDGSFNPFTLETGRVEKGLTSNQQFVEIDMDFEKNYIHHIVYQLLPTSRKPIEVEKEKLKPTGSNYFFHGRDTGVPIYWNTDYQHYNLLLKHIEFFGEDYYNHIKDDFLSDKDEKYVTQCNLSKYLKEYFHKSPL